MSGHPAVTATVFTHRGAVREGNEDAFVVGALTAAGVEMSEPVTCVLPVRRPLVVAVADGLGGHAAGEVASEHAVRRLAEAGESLDGPQAIGEVLGGIDDELRRYAAAHPTHAGMATTIAGLTFAQDGVFWFNVGDSRAYRITGDGLKQISVDDSPPVPGAEPGTPEAVTNIVTQTLGGASVVDMTPHIEREDDAAEAWLLCSDGLSDLVPSETIAKVLRDEASDAAALRTLWAAAMNASGRDNITIVLARKTTI